MMRRATGVLPRLMRLAAGCCMAAGGLLPAQAQELPGAELEEIRRFAVEIIIFRYAEDVSIGSERFLPEALQIEENASDDGEMPLVSVPAVEPDPTPADAPARWHDIDLTMLPGDALTMNDIADRLERLDVYEPVMHFGWTQATWPEERAQPLPLSRFGALPDGLNGTLELYLGRYLHLVVDLALDGPDVVPVARDDIDRYGRVPVGEVLGYLDERADAGTVRYRIREDRIFRAGELRYFDHPKFGMLAKVIRVEDDEDEADTELLGYGPE